MGLSTFPAGGRVWLYFLDKPDLPFGRWELFWCVRGLWQLIMSMRPKERVKKNEERIEESAGNVGGFWLNHDKQEWTAIEELAGAEHEWSLWENPEAEKD
jgi:hypothetical protein